MGAREFSQVERCILAVAGDNLPDGPEPFARIAEACGTDEETVLDLLARLKDEGVIRRFGATLRHQKAGYGKNAMVAWRVEPPHDARAVGELMAARPEISHCYERRTYPEWKYNLYTMIHGKNAGDCARTARELSDLTGISDWLELKSVRELKKTSMRYFRREEDHE